MKNIIRSRCMYVRRQYSVSAVIDRMRTGAILWEKGMSLAFCLRSLLGKVARLRRLFEPHRIRLADRRAISLFVLCDLVVFAFCHLRTLLLESRRDDHFMRSPYSATEGPWSFERVGRR